MAQEVRSFTVSIPAGTLSTAPQVTDLSMPARLVREVRVRIPPGPAGTVGFALAASGVAVVPWNAGQWLVGNDETIVLPLADQITSGAWQLRAYNVGVFAHTLYVTFLLDIPQLQPGATIGLLPLDLSPSS